MTSAGDYVAMCKALLDNVRWFDASPVGSPAGSPFDADQLAAVVRAQQAQLARVVNAARRAASADDWRLTGLPEEAGRIALSRALAQLAGALT